PQALAEQVASLLEQARTRQRQVAERYAGLEVKYQPRRSTGRGTTAQQVMRNIDMIQYVVARAGPRWPNWPNATSSARPRCARSWR
ncbi:hypothetical protein, partial [Arthrobacter sp. JCM 19049]|uniref:hypothetical protein n=1 Tax=Arthrobacter sp. JCM 19049 TaxID=1460643 RepID=UPI000A3F25E6